MKKFKAFLDTPALWTKTQFGLRQFELPEIDLENFSSRSIPENLRLGHQVEHIFEQLITHSNVYDVLAHNLQIKREKETIGEIDFILRSKDDHQKLLHVELTYKFYLLDPSIQEPIRSLVGPNRGDMFFTKLEKTKHKQLPLLYTPEGKQALHSRGIESKHIEQQCCFLGQLFVPFQLDSPAIDTLNNNCVIGFWVDFTTFNTQTFKNYTYYIPSKKEWLLAPHNHVTWSSHLDTGKEIYKRHLQNRSPMIWIKKKEDTFEKCFVVWWAEKQKLQR